MSDPQNPIPENPADFRNADSPQRAFDAYMEKVKAERPTLSRFEYNAVALALMKGTDVFKEPGGLDEFLRKWDEEYQKKHSPRKITLDEAISYICSFGGCEVGIDGFEEFDIPPEHAMITLKPLTDKMQPGDELWFFTSCREAWEFLAGREGIALVRNGEIIHEIVTTIN